MKGSAGQNFWWVAPIFTQAKIAFRRLKRGLPGDAYAANESELTLTLANGAIIWFKGADKPTERLKAVRGDADDDRFLSARLPRMWRRSSRGTLICCRSARSGVRSRWS